MTRRVDPAETQKVVDKIIDKVKNGPAPSGQPSGRAPLRPQPTWECQEHKHILPQNEACPDCGKQLLLG